MAADGKLSMTFGRRIAEARKRAGMSLKELAALIKKADGQPISPQYLNDIEHDRRQPDSNHLIEQFAAALKIKPEVLYYDAGKLGEAMKQPHATEEDIVGAYRAFRKSLKP
jgi:transcriptional regulator with XRE-family HTH domain